MIDFIAEFADAMRAHGFTPKDGKVHADDKWHQAYFGDERGAKCSGAYTMKIVDGSFAIGCYFTRKDPENKFSWHSNTGEAMTSTERRLQKDRLEKYQQEKREAEEARQKRLAILLTAAYKKYPKVKKHAYLDRKGIQPHGVKIRPKTGELIIPIWGVDGRVWTVQKINEHGGKYLFTGGKKSGGYFSFVDRNQDKSIVLICEGFATGATLREATGLPVCACVDAGNIKPSLRNLADKYPMSQFVICADNDQFTFNQKYKPEGLDSKAIAGNDKRWPEWRAQGLLWNVGEDKAKEAAASIGGAWVALPHFKKVHLENKPTDFNDLAALDGLEEVKRQVMKIVEAIPERVEPVPLLDPRGLDQQQGDGGFNLPPVEPSKDQMDEEKMRACGDLGMTFRCLGFREKSNFYYSFPRRQILSLLPSEHSIKNLLQLDKLQAWQNKDEFTAAGTIKCTSKDFEMYVTNVLNQFCRSRGTFHPDSTARGAGVWEDDGRLVVNTGMRLFVDGVMKDVYEIEGKYVYVSDKEWLRPHKVKPLVKSESERLLELCKMVTWASPSSAVLLAGWIVIAPICGVLSYRPHIWVTGESQSGKSTVRDQIIRRALGEFGMYTDGGTTEASIREQIGYSTRPIIYDEAEADETHTANVMALARLATSGGTIGKAGQSKKEIRFCICFSSVSPSPEKTTDQNRYSLLKIKKNTKPTALEDYEKLLETIDEVLTKDFSDRLFARAVEKMPELLSTIKVFKRVVRLKTKDARGAEQIGTLVAGAFFLCNDHVPNEAEATTFIADFQWKDQSNLNLQSDPVRLLNHAQSAIVRYNLNGMSRENTLGNLIYMAKTNDEIAKIIGMYGIKVEQSKVFINGNDRNFKTLLRDTPWRANPMLMLENLEGAEKHNYKYISASSRSSAISLPMDYFSPTEPERLLTGISLPEEEIPFDD